MASTGQVTPGQIFEVTQAVLGTKFKRRKKTEMTPQPETNEVNDQEQNEQLAQAGEVKRIQKTVFDLTKFQNVTLYKDVTTPNKPGSVNDALKLFNNDTEKVLEVFYRGLIAKTMEDAQKPQDGKLVDFHYGQGDYPLDTKNPLGPVYDGSYADEDKKALINSAVLSMAKMLGYSQDNSADKNAELKAQAMKVIRDNPVMMKSLQG